MTSRADGCFNSWMAPRVWDWKARWNYFRGVRPFSVRLHSKGLDTIRGPAPEFLSDKVTARGEKGRVLLQALVRCSMVWCCGAVCSLVTWSVVARLLLYSAIIHLYKLQELGHLKSAGPRFLLYRTICLWISWILSRTVSYLNLLYQRKNKLSMTIWAYERH